MKGEKEKGEEISLQNAKVGQIIELISKLDILGGETDREGLAYALGINKNSLSHPLKAAEILGLVTIRERRVQLTARGKEFAQVNEDARKKIFEECLSSVEPFATILRASRNGTQLTFDEVRNLVKAKVVAARKWKASTGDEMMRVISNWFDFIGIKFAEGRNVEST
ncbi:MAG: AAA-associated domain-containing protein [Candidatus Bathyarchaeia archaeon]